MGRLNIKTGHHVYFFILALAFLGILLVAGCNNEMIDKDNVIVSILPQKFFVNEITKGDIKVSAMIPPGGSPATYSPLPSDLAKVENARIYFKIGHIPFERAYMKKITSLNKDLIVVDTSKGIKFRMIGDSIDPHIWLSPRLVKIQAENIYEGLVKAYPEKKDRYLKNLNNFKNELDELHNYIASRLYNAKNRKLLVFHPSWGYFCDEFNLTQIAIENEGKETTIEQLKDIVDMIKKEDIKYIIVQKQFNMNIARSISDETGIKILSLDPLDDDYINNMKRIGDEIGKNN